MAQNIRFSSVQYLDNISRKSLEFVVQVNHMLDQQNDGFKKLEDQTKELQEAVGYMNGHLS